MGCVSSKGLSKEVIVSASVAPQPGAASSDNGSDVKSSLGKGSAEPVMLCDTRGFEVEVAREGAVKSLGVVDTPIDDPRFNAITKLMSSIFQTPVALITLITEDRVWFKSKVGPFGACVTREGSWCNYISVPNTPEVLITEDASEDARFAANPYVAGAPFIKFYAGAPLVGRGGMRYGTLCVVDLKRRSFSAEMYALLINFANLVVQELERDTGAMREVRDEASVVAEGQAHIAKMVKAATSGVALMDVRTRSWPVLYANNAFAAAEGGDSVEACTTQGFWDLFEPVEGGSKGEVMKRLDAAVAASRPARAALTSKLTGARVSVVLRPGSSDQLKPAKVIGIPNWVPSEKAPQVGCHAGVLPGGLDNGGDAFEGPAGTEAAPQPQLATCFWFAEVEGLGPVPALGSAGSDASGVLVQSAGSAATTVLGAPATPLGTEGSLVAPGSAGSAASSLHTFSSHSLPDLLAGLEMGPLIGSGSFGRVYRGLWRSEVVAVKLIDCVFTSGGGTDTATMAALEEAELSKRLEHPCIVKTYEYALREPQASGRSGGTLWMVQQMCNHGTLIEAVDRGWMRCKRSLTAAPDMAAVLRTLHEVAAGMQFLHSQDILHCDLTGNNVLLDATEPSAEDHRAFRARVGDFGLARVAAGEVTTATFGTCSHMSPELMTDGVLTKAADVWSFGVLCWEMYSGVRAYVGMRMPHIVYLVTSGKGALTLPPGAPKGFKELMESCLNRDHTKRPSFSDVISTIDALLAAGPEQPVMAPPLPSIPACGPCKAAADEMSAAANAMQTAAA